MLLNKTLRLFLDSIGRREEYEYYLQRFADERSLAFAVLVPDLVSVEETADVFAFDMRFLLRLGLNPVVVLAGKDADLMEKGLLVEDHPFMVETVAGQVRALSSESMQPWLHQARACDRALLLKLPDFELEDALNLLVPALTRRLHFIRVRGPLHGADGLPLSFYDTNNPVPLAAEDVALAALAEPLLRRVEGLHLSIASPLRLLEELFTVKGAGCLVRQGTPIEHLRSLSDNQRLRVVQLLESGFGRRLCDHGFLDRVTDVYLEHHYRGVAMLEPCDTGMYLSKFTVQTSARGEGLAQELWRRLAHMHPAIVWRSGHSNSVNHWYERQADGSHTQGPWRVFWRGIAVNQIPQAVELACSRPPDFEPPAATST